MNIRSALLIFCAPRRVRNPSVDNGHCLPRNRCSQRAIPYVVAGTHLTELFPPGLPRSLPKILKNEIREVVLCNQSCYQRPNRCDDPKLAVGGGRARIQHGCMGPKVLNFTRACLSKRRKWAAACCQEAAARGKNHHTDKGNACIFGILNFVSQA